MWKKIDNYFRDMVASGWHINTHLVDGFNGNSYDKSHYIRLSYVRYDWDNRDHPYLLEHFRYKIHITHRKLKNGKYLYIMDGEFYGNQDEVIDELKRIGVK